MQSMCVSLKQGLVVTSMIFEEMNARCQVDLIDMQAQQDGEYKYILVHQGLLTNISMLFCGH